ncbi:phage tail tape measure protein [Pectobacterium parvum]|uniref:phage tail tape measure protein n=1 Tax=Pectobacterium TaxID=122277 RepID=UPI0013FE123A|nr:phage tail tape measure protein [Pectobacterium polaris]
MRELGFLLSLKNQLSAPLGRAQQSVEQFANRSAEALGRVAIGAAGLWGVAQSVKGLLDPANEVKRALDELSTRNVSTQSLDKIYQSAQAFSTAYGKSAAEFVASATVIRSSVAGITDDELPRYTTGLNTLAVATKSSAEGAASYMNDMANNFSTVAKRMGNIPFAEMMASKGAYMVQNFGTSLDELKELVKSSKGTGTQMGVGMDEQFAVMGMLKQTKGTEAGGIYDAFLKSAVEGGKQLGLSFTDAQGKMLQFPDILQKLQGKFGSSIEGNIKAQAALNKAFGDGAQALTATWGQADKLRQHMRDMGNTQGLDRATEMAKKMADMWERLDKVWERIRVSIGMRLIPAISPLGNTVIAIGEKFAKWLDMFPNITRWLGYIALSTLAFAAAGATANIIFGASKFVWSGLLPLWSVGAKSLALMTGKLNVMAAVSTKVTAALGWLKTSFLMTKISAWAAAIGINAAIWPILAIIAAIALVVVAVVKFWHPIKAFFKGFVSGFGEASGALAPLSPLFDLLGAAIGIVWQGVKILFGWFSDLLTPIAYSAEELAGVTSAGEMFGRIVAEAIGLILAPIGWVVDACRWLDGVFADLWSSIQLGWEMAVNFFAGLSPVAAFSGFVDSITNIFNGLWASLMDSFTQTYNFIAKGLNYLPGINIDLKPTTGSGLAAPAGVTAPTMQNGGISKTLQTNNQSTANTRKTEIASVNIYPPNGATFTSIAESQELAAG